MSNNTYGYKPWYTVAVLIIGPLLAVVALVVSWAIGLISFDQLCGFGLLVFVVCGFSIFTFGVVYVISHAFINKAEGSE